MDENLAAAEAALKAGDKGEAVSRLIAALEADPKRPAQIYRVLCHQLYQLNRAADGAKWAARASQQLPKEMEFWNFQAIFLRALRRYDEALAAAEEAVRLAPKDISPLTNRANILFDRGDYARAETEWSKLLKREPKNSNLHRMLARAMMKLAKSDAAIARLRQSILFDRNNLHAWLDLAGFQNELGRTDEALATLDKAAAVFPDNREVLSGRVSVLRSAGRIAEADAYLADLLARLGDVGWVHHRIGLALAYIDRDKANIHLRKAVDLDPTFEHMIALVDSLFRTRGYDEAAVIEEAYHIAKRAVAGPTRYEPPHLKVLADLFWRMGDYERTAQLGDFASLGRQWALKNLHAALLGQMGRVTGPGDVAELLAQHRLWGETVERRAAATPIKHPAPRAPGGKIRLGFMSSDLRSHPVAYFSMPLFEHIDRERFEVFCYSYATETGDPIQKRISAMVTGFRSWPDISDREAAQRIADDQLDMLIELGGSTWMNKLEVMAYRPAPRQASWLGYPHSAGLSTIDYFICDPYSQPARPELLIEKPLLMPSTWIALGRHVFSNKVQIEPGLPSDRVGRVTFGTANNPHKYNPAMLALWAEVLKAVPDSRFVFIRPEGGGASFVKNMRDQFAANGVDPDRIEFRPVRGTHMPIYNELDISLDTVPLTGGTTTTESLWMGVPVVSLVGEAFFERLSYSILTNAGVPDLATWSREAFVETAVKLAADRERRLALRTGLRESMSTGPLGQTEEFSRDFYDMIANVVTAGA